MVLTRGEAGGLTWAVAERPCGGEVESGDAFAVLDREQGPLIAVFDGLGHGPEAARAARAAVAAVGRSCDQPIKSLLDRCAMEVRAIRGVVATVCSFDLLSSRLTWAAIGNVAGLVLDRPGEAGGRPREVVQIGGVIGPTPPEPRPETVAFPPGALLVLATDGIHPDFRQALDDAAGPAELAGRLLAVYGVEGDDALVLVACSGPAGRPGTV